MEKKILLIFLYIGLLVFIKNQGLMKVQENRGFYIDNIDLGKDAFLEASICTETAVIKRINGINIINQKKITS